MKNRYNILLLSKYDNLGPSSRVRFFQYIKYLEENGLKITIQPLMPNSYIESIMSGKKFNKFKVFYYYFRRFIFLLFYQKKYDLIWLEKELFPYSPYVIEKFLLKKDYILDYDDAVFHLYDKNKSSLIRFFLSKKISKIMYSSKLVICGNQYLREYAEQAKAKNIITIPTVVSKKKYDIQELKENDNDNIIIGWIGSSTTEIYLKDIESVFSKLSKDFKIELHCIGAKNLKINNVNLKIIPWSDSTEVELLRKIDIGIMPLHFGHFEQGKCGYKLIQYMALSKPVIASPVGVNKMLVQNNINGFLANNLDEWYNFLTILLKDKEKRLAMGAEGKSLFLSSFTKEIYEDKLLNLFFNILNTNN
ncbi:glycosyltransferase [Silvanigrella paludirubra]|uniref:Glycosyltransferase n=1 Tax=Silvanigrella paludirubra TaxID=2499159 RepID=A0A6N6VNR6_9BACT|nr:glycosyltransferase [Silvanigrella paludirubra]KAB8036833.1 glycosyltransferase [Silvanigrella paludirubra]